MKRQFWTLILFWESNSSTKKYQNEWLVFHASTSWSFLSSCYYYILLFHHHHSLSQLVKVIFEFNDVNCFYRWVFSMSIILVSRVPLQSNMTIKHQLQHLAAAAHMIRDWNHAFTYINGEWSVRSKLIGSQFHFPFKNSFFKHADTYTLSDKVS